MKLKHSRIIEKVLEEAVAKIAAVDRDEVYEFVTQCATEVAAHCVSATSTGGPCPIFRQLLIPGMGNIQCEKVDDADYWDAQIDSFEAGLKVGAAMGPGDRVFTAGLDADAVADLTTDFLFYFVGKKPHEVAKRLREASVDWLDSLRKDKGLLPFSDFPFGGPSAPSPLRGNR